ncbi:unnamed protein product [Lota lota]
MLQPLDYLQQLPPGDAIIPLCPTQSPAVVGLFSIRFLLGQDSPNHHIACVSVHNEQLLGITLCTNTNMTAHHSVPLHYYGNTLVQNDGYREN